MSHPTASTLTLLVVVLATSSLAAEQDRVELVTGEVFYGTVLRATSEEVSIQLASGGILSFRDHRVKDVHWSNSPSDESSEADELGPLLPAPRPTSAPQDLAEFPPIRVEKWTEPEPRKATPSRPVPPSSAGYSSAEHGFAFDPPSTVFLSTLPPPSGTVVRFTNDETRTEVRVETFPADKATPEMKRQLIRSYPRKFRRFQVHVDEPIERQDLEAHWVEISARRDREDIRQGQLVVRTPTEILVFTWSAPSAAWSSSFGELVEKSRDTVRLVEKRDES